MPFDIRRFIGQLLLFLLLPAIVAGIMEIGLRKIPNDYSAKRDALESQLDRINVLVLGTSQAVKGVNPAEFSCSGFNLAADSQPLSIDSALLMHYVDRMPHLHLVLLGVSYFSLQYQMEDSPNAWEEFFYQHFWGLPPPPGSLFDPRRYSFIALYRPGSSLWYALQRFHVSLVESGLQSNGWVSLPNRMGGPSTAASMDQRIVDLEAQMRRPAIRPNMAILDHVLSELSRRGIKAAIFLPPLPTALRSRLQPEIVAENKDIVTRLCVKYGCRVLDYQASGVVTDADFFDTDHLSADGANKLSRLLNQETVDPVCGPPNHRIDARS